MTPSDFCPTCGMVGLATRTGKNGRDYLAHVAVYPNGASYFRALHTREECDQYKTEQAKAAADEKSWRDAVEAWRLEGIRLREAGLIEECIAHVAKMPTREAVAR